MPRQAAGRGDRPVAFELQVQLLACEFHLAVECSRLAAWLAAAVPGAIQEYPVSSRHHIEVLGEPGRYRLRERGPERAVAAGVDEAGTELMGRLHQLALDALGGYTKVHAGCASLGGRRLMAVGAGRSGKTTLMARLLYEGFDVQGDEMVLLRDGLAVAYPRRFGVRQPTLWLVPELAGVAPDLARTPVAHGYQVLALDPASIGFSWRIVPGPLDLVVHLEPARDQPSRLAPCAQHLMAQRIMAQSEPPATGRREWIRHVSAIISRASCYTLALGDLDSAVLAVREALRRVAAGTVQPDGA